MFMFESVDEAIADLEVVEQFELPSRTAEFRPIPRRLFDSRVGLYLNRHLKDFNGLWSHQADALDAVLDDKNVVLSTGTASGKSLVFRSAVFHRLLLRQSRKALIFYPLKALAADQLTGWREAAKELDLPETFIGRIDGSVPMTDRDSILGNARVVIMTPDVCHAWLLSNVAKPNIQSFIKSLDLVVLDEAHTLESVFGSNFAFLFRRIMGVRNSLLPAEDRNIELNVIAATATIEEPAGHLEALTGMQFESIDQSQDGSPQFERRCIHIRADAGEELTVARKIHVSMLQSSGQGGFITFVDSRKGVEMLAVRSNAALKELLPTEEVLPYRAGFDARDRQRIEQALKEGSLRGVVSTSALELGIDLPHLQVGLNIGVPNTRKAYRQRLGRVGRNTPGIFMIIAPDNAFRSFGSTFREYHDRSVEPSLLYLNNRFMQYAHARCLVDELEAIGARDRSSVPTRIHWPEQFDQIYKWARPGGDRPREFDAVAEMGGDVPQRGYPLRNVAEVNFKISQGEHADAIGDISLAQALRECYPGATYFHRARAYKVRSWQTNAYEPYIRVKSTPNMTVTRPRIRTWINAGLTSSDIIDGHIRKGGHGFMAECEMQITERVEGFQEGDGPYRSYQELRASNPNYKPRLRNFRTTGVLISIEQDWFSDADIRRTLQDHLLDIFCREFSVMPQDVGAASTNITLRTREGTAPTVHCIALFDQTYGSLRLTERCYSRFADLIERVKVAVESEEHLADRASGLQLYDSLKAFESTLDETVSGEPQIDLSGDDSRIRVFAKGSRVGLREQGPYFTEVEIIAPALLPPDDALMYQVKCPPKASGSPPVTRWVNPDFVEPTAASDEWAYALWDRITQSYVEENDDVE